MLTPLCKKCSERFLQNGAFSSGLRRGLSYAGSARMQEMWVFSCMDLSVCPTHMPFGRTHHWPDLRAPRSLGRPMINVYVTGKNG